MSTLALILASIVAVAVLLLLINTFLLKGDYRISQSILIAKPPAEVFAKVADLRSWPAWSPWLLHEPDSPLEYSDSPPVNAVGGSYSWNGQRIGAGKMTQTLLDDPKHIAQRLEFIKPFRSVCQVFWDFAASDGGTEVSWSMEGSMPFLFRFMTARTVRMISEDYRFGLLMLQRELDPEADSLKLSFEGNTDLPASTCVAKAYSGDLQGLIAAMPETFRKLQAAASKGGQGNKGESAGQPRIVYGPMNKDRSKVQADLAVPTKGEGAGGDFHVVEYPGGRYSHTLLRGDYRFLELAWNQAFMHLRMAGEKFDSKRKPFEVYDNDPGDQASPRDYQTSLYIPVK